MHNMTKDAVKLLRRVQKLILKDPKRLYMPDLIVRKTKNFFGLPASRFPSCETVGCIAGWVVLLHDGMGAEANENNAKRAAEILGLDYYSDLFFATGGEKFQSAWEGRGTLKEAKLIARR